MPRSTCRCLRSGRAATGTSGPLVRAIQSQIRDVPDTDDVHPPRRCALRRSRAFPSRWTCDTARGPTSTKPPRDSVARMDIARREMPGMPRMFDTAMKHGMVPEPLGISVDRMGSGTTWIPDAVPLPSRHFTADKWDMMLDGFAFGQFNHQGGPRGASQFGLPNWGMCMASHDLAGGRFLARTMLSLDPATVTGRGYPLLLQTGKSFHGEEPLHDRQRPRDSGWSWGRCTNEQCPSTSASSCMPRPRRAGAGSRRLHAPSIGDG